MVAASEAALVVLRVIDAGVPICPTVFNRRDGVAVVDDSYYVDPASTAAAWRALAALGQGWWALAVLGHVAELGEYERFGYE
jgi:UDP-N-acetylmuramoyl-tripeptide--D-alanyl-D-alanine ligase